MLHTLVENAVRLCSAQQGFIFRANGELYDIAVDYNAPPIFREWLRDRPVRAGDGSVVGRVAHERRTIQILDPQADPEWRARNTGAPGIGDIRTLLGVPMLVGASRKAFIGRLLGGAAPEERTIGTLAAHAVAALNGASIVRVHDVREAREFFTVFDALSSR